MSGVSADQGVNNADGMRMAFDEANAKGGVNGRKIRFIVEDMEYTVLTTDTDFNGPWPNRETPTAIIVLGSIAKDTVIILQTAHKQ